MCSLFFAEYSNTPTQNDRKINVTGHGVINRVQYITLFGIGYSNSEIPQT